MSNKAYILFICLITGAMNLYAETTKHRSPYASHRHNWRARCIAQGASVDPSIVLDTGLIAVDYLDGLGRCVQSQTFGFGRGGMSGGAVSAQVLDFRGRVVESMPPAGMSSSGYYFEWDELAIEMQEPQSCTTATDYEANIFGRALSTRRAGQYRRRHNKTIESDYTHIRNTRNSLYYCPQLIVKDNKIQAQNTRKFGDVAVSAVMDEDAEMHLTFTDARGRKVLERVRTASGRKEDTMYMYDHAGRLIYIIPPALSAKLLQGEAIDLEGEDAGWLYSYKYDWRERIVEQRMPGAGITRIAYNEYSQQSLWQDEALAAQSKSLHTTYDEHKRPAYVSVLHKSVNDFSSDYVKANVHYVGPGFTAHFGYTYPPNVSNITQETLLSINYYDDYSFLSIFPALSDSLSWRTVSGCDTQATAARKRLTGTAQRIIDHNGPIDRWQVSAFYYDKKGRLIQSVSNNMAGGYDRTALALGFDGRPLRSVHHHTDTAALTVRERAYSYDTQGRAVCVRMRTNGGAWVSLSSTSYDPRGWILSQSLLDGEVPVTYTYTDTGELTGITSAPFTQTIFRDEPATQGTQGGRVPLYNGRVSGEEFSLSSYSGTRPTNASTRSLDYGYAYVYDGVRLTGASYTETNRQYTQPLGVIQSGITFVNPDYSESTTYNGSGLPASIKRKGLYDITTVSGSSSGGVVTIGRTTEYQYGLVDDLQLTYKAERLDRVDDHAENESTLSTATDFTEAVQRDGEYEYDTCGRLIRDRNKGVSISYNILGLPAEVSCGSERIRYTYSSDGELLRTQYGAIVMESTGATGGFVIAGRPVFKLTGERLRCGEVEYTDGRIERIWNEVGWTNSAGQYVAAIRDSRGSLRATYTMPSQSGTPALRPVQRTKTYGNLTAYYPGGLPFADWQGDDRYLFSGKEFERSGGLLTYDFHARVYDPQLGLFNRPDPCADTYPGQPVYLYCAGNPVSLTDPTGCIIKYDESAEQYKNQIEDIFNKSELLSFLYKYVEDSEKSVLIKIGDLYSDQAKEQIAGHVVPNAPGSEYDMTMTLNPKVPNHSAYIEEFYHAYQHMFPNRDEGENYEFEAKHFRANIGAEAIGGDIYFTDYKKDGWYWNKVAYLPGLNINMLNSTEFQNQYLEIGEHFFKQYEGYDNRSPYKQSITKVPNSLIWIYQNYNTK